MLANMFLAVESFSPSLLVCVFAECCPRIDVWFAFDRTAVFGTSCRPFAFVSAVPGVCFNYESPPAHLRTDLGSTDSAMFNSLPKVTHLSCETKVQGRQ